MSSVSASECISPQATWTMRCWSKHFSRVGVVHFLTSPPKPSAPLFDVPHTYGWKNIKHGDVLRLLSKSTEKNNNLLRLWWERFYAIVQQKSWVFRDSSQKKLIFLAKRSSTSSRIHRHLFGTFPIWTKICMNGNNINLSYFNQTRDEDVPTQCIRDGTRRRRFSPWRNMKTNMNWTFWFGELTACVDQEDHEAPKPELQETEVTTDLGECGPWLFDTIFTSAGSSGKCNGGGGLDLILFRIK